jgi:hypothetical protein
MWCISVRTSWPAFLLYLRPLDFFRELELDFLLRLRERLELRDLDELAMLFYPPLNGQYAAAVPGTSAKSDADNGKRVGKLCAFPPSPKTAEKWRTLEGTAAMSA